MAYTKFSDMLDAVTNATWTAAQHDNEVEGIQNEFEGRMEDFGLNGVVSGMAGSISGTDIAIASGVAYVEGKKFVGSDTVSFTGEAADDYYVYVDPTAESAPYLKKATAPTDGELTICKVTWSGSALSALQDRREWGLIGWQHSYFTAGSVTTGHKDFIILDRDIWLQDVRISVTTLPSATSIIVDIHAGNAGSAPATIWSDTTYRPTVPTPGGAAYTPYSATGYITTNRKLDAGDIIEIHVDQADNAALDLSVVLIGRWLV